MSPPDPLLSLHTHCLGSSFYQPPAHGPLLTTDTWASFPGHDPPDSPSSVLPGAPVLNQLLSKAFKILFKAFKISSHDFYERVQETPKLYFLIDHLIV